jgi:hypothetical protein
MGIFNAQLAADIAKHNIGKSCLYNADQTGLFYAILPNRMFVKKGTEKFIPLKFIDYGRAPPINFKESRL